MTTLASQIVWTVNDIHDGKSLEIRADLALPAGPVSREFYINADDVANHGPHLFYLCWMQQQEMRREVWG